MSLAIDVINTIEPVKTQMRQSQFVSEWETLAEDAWLVIQADAIGGDATAQAYITANRAILINNDGVNHTLELNGQPWIFVAATAYCMSSGESAYFLDQALNHLPVPFAIVETNTAAFVASGVVQFFTE